MRLTFICSNLSNNQLTVLKSNDFVGLGSLLWIFLGGNNIQIIEEGTFAEVNTRHATLATGGLPGITWRGLGDPVNEATSELIAFHTDGPFFRCSNRLVNDFPLVRYAEAAPALGCAAHLFAVPTVT